MGSGVVCSSKESKGMWHRCGMCVWAHRYVCVCEPQEGNNEPMHNHRVQR